jgi:hypothetical protein
LIRRQGFEFVLTHRLNRRRLGQASALSLISLPLGGRSIEVSAAMPTWREITPGGELPAPRWDHTLAADDDGKQLIVFGGRDSNGAALADLWVFDRRVEGWSPVESAGPAARFGHAVATIQGARIMYLFGGQSADQFYNDLWSLDFATMTWTQIDDGSASAPAPRYGTSLVETGAGKLIVSHGFTFEGRFDDTWRFETAERAWTDLTPPNEADRPLKRCLHEAIWSTVDKRMLLFGGCSSGFGPCPQGDFWAFDPQETRWSQITSDTGPSARSNPAFVWDGPRKQALLFGGLTESGYDAGLWSLAGEAESLAWTNSTPAEGPPARASHDLAITGPRLYLFGGTNPDGARNDLWLLDLSEP